MRKVCAIILLHDHFTARLFGKYLVVRFFWKKYIKKDKTIANCVYSVFRSFSRYGMIVKNFEKF
ncbi:hypothetical protein E3T57_12400 [Enterococcus faecium]|nr:hypothetical protein E3T57_12400 [Enterococcus faecium]